MVADKEILENINKWRISNRKAPLKFDMDCAKQASMHSENMASKKVKFSHDGLSDRLQAINDAKGYKCQGSENVYMAKPNLGDPVESWKKSPGHNKNLLNENFNCCGIGIACSKDNEFYVTAIFMKLK